MFRCLIREDVASSRRGQASPKSAQDKRVQRAACVLLDANHRPVRRDEDNKLYKKKEKKYNVKILLLSRFAQRCNSMA